MGAKWNLTSLDPKSRIALRKWLPDDLEVDLDRILMVMGPISVPHALGKKVELRVAKPLGLPRPMTDTSRYDALFDAFTRRSFIDSFPIETAAT